MPDEATQIPARLADVSYDVRKLYVIFSLKISSILNGKENHNSVLNNEEMDVRLGSRV